MAFLAIYSIIHCISTYPSALYLPSKIFKDNSVFPDFNFNSFKDMVQIWFSPSLLQKLFLVLDKITCPVAGRNQKSYCSSDSEGKKKIYFSFQMFFSIYKYWKTKENADKRGIDPMADAAGSLK